MPVYQKGDWISHKHMKIVGKILSVDTENREYEIKVADALPTQNWAFAEAEFYQEGGRDKI